LYAVEKSLTPANSLLLAVGKKDEPWERGWEGEEGHLAPERERKKSVGKHHGILRNQAKRIC
jgi:hypothetical protein